MKKDYNKMWQQAAKAAADELNRELQIARDTDLQQHLKTLGALLASRDHAMGFVRLLIAMSHQAHACKDTETHDQAIRVAFALLVQIEGRRLNEESKNE